MAAPNIETSSNPTTTGANASGVKVGEVTTQTLGFYGATGTVQPTVSGALTATTVVLASLLTALDGLGLINDTTTPT